MSSTTAYSTTYTHTDLLLGTGVPSATSSPYVLMVLIPRLVCM